MDKDQIKETLQDSKWDPDIFAAKPYDKAFWESYNILLESEEDEQLIEDFSPNGLPYLKINLFGQILLWQYHASYATTLFMYNSF